MKRFSGQCLECGKPTKEQKRGLCLRCYQLKYHDRDLAPCCEVCGFGDKRMLVRRQMTDEEEGKRTLCGNCATLKGRRKMTVEELRDELYPPTDRRQGDRRQRPVRRTYIRRDGIDQRLWDREDSSERRDTNRRA